MYCLAMQNDAVPVLSQSMVNTYEVAAMVAKHVAWGHAGAHH
jgi:hypothetical protein